MAESGSLSLVQGEEPNKVNTVPALWLAPVSPSRVTAYLVTLACAFYTFLVQITSWGAASYFLTGQNGSYRGYLYAPMSLSPLTVLNQSLSLSHQEGQLGCRQSCLWSPAASLGQCGPAWRRGPRTPGSRSAAPISTASPWVGESSRPDLRDPRKGSVSDLKASM